MMTGIGWPADKRASHALPLIHFGSRAIGDQVPEWNAIAEQWQGLAERIGDVILAQSRRELHADRVKHFNLLYSVLRYSIRIDIETTPDVWRLLDVVFFYLNDAIADYLADGLPNRPGMDSALCLGTLLSNRMYSDDQGRVTVPPEADPLEAGQKWLQRLRRRPLRLAPVNQRVLSSDEIISALLRYLPGKPGRPRSDCF